MVLGEEGFDTAVAIARSAKARGELTIEFEIEAQMGFARHVSLWHGLVGEIVGRVFAEQERPSTIDAPIARVVDRFRVRLNVTSVLAAERTRASLERRQYGSAMP